MSCIKFCVLILLQKFTGVAVSDTDLDPYHRILDPRIGIHLEYCRSVKPEIAHFRGADGAVSVHQYLGLQLVLSFAVE